MLKHFLFQIDGISVRGLSESQIVMLLNAKRISLSVKRYVPVQNGNCSVSLFTDWSLWYTWAKLVC